MGKVRAAAKPLDVGNGLVCASFGVAGGWLSVGTVHPTHGFVELTGMPPFDERWRGDPSATRRFRSRMTRDRFAFLALNPAVGPMRAAPVEWLRPAWHARSGIVVSAWAVPGTRTIVQRWGHWRGRPRIRFSGRLDLPALAEITEVDAPPAVVGSSRLVGDGQRLLVLAPHLPAAAVVEASSGTWILDDGDAWLEVPSGQLTLRCAIAPTTDLPSLADPDSPSSVGEDPARVDADLPVELQRIAHRALTYVRGCTALALRAGERAILTDHRLLPLSWTRDAYYQALLLLATGTGADVERVADHLRWLWRRCERPDGRWMRSHHADGRRKDHVFQADQQLYPLVELADFWRATGNLPEGVDWAAAVPSAWRATLREVDGSTGLIASGETAGDDAAVVPFIAAAQILLWYAARRAADVADEAPIGLDPADLHAVAADVHAAFDQHIVAYGPWAYAVDGAGRRVDYHDANDLPTALAPLLGFCGSDDPAWRATMSFAFSPKNPGFVPGSLGGLGSTHTPGPWPLGEIQAWIHARTVGDESSARIALGRLARMAFADGMLPEASSVRSNLDGHIRHWFAWPGAALGALLLLDARGELEQRLAASAG